MSFLKSIFVLSAVVSVSASAEVSKTCISEHDGNIIEINRDSVSISYPDQKREMERYPKNQETIMKSYSSSSVSILGDSSSICRADTYVATTVDDMMVLVKAHKVGIEPASYMGLSCLLAQDIKDYLDPYAYGQIVLLFKKDGTMVKREIFVMDSLDRPQLSVEQLQNPRLIEENSEFRAYVEKEVQDTKFSKAWVSLEQYKCQ